MRFGLSERDWEALHALVLRPLTSAGAKVWIFGSRARGNHKKFSDIDILFELTPPNPALLGVIREAAENSNLPYKVDVVPLNEMAASYLPGVMKDRIPLE